MCSPKKYLLIMSSIEPKSPSKVCKFYQTWAQFGEVLLFLGICSIPRLEMDQYGLSRRDFFRSWPVNLVYTKVAVGPIAESNGSTCSADLLHCNDMIQVTHAWAPIFWVGSDAQEANVAQFSPEALVVWEVICFVNCICMWCKLLKKPRWKKSSEISATMSGLLLGYLLAEVKDSLP